MVYIQFLKESDTRAFVNYIHYNPLDANEGLGKTADELSLTGVLIDALPQLEKHDGKDAKLYINPLTKELWYEYIDIPLPAEDRIAQLEKENIELRKSNLDTQEAILELYEMLMGTPTT